MVSFVASRDGGHDEMIPFDSVEDAWFWFIQAQTARNDGAKVTSGAGRFVRPCEPVDIFREVERLYRNRRLEMDHLKVLKHYGVRLMSPDPHRVKEARAYSIWTEAMERLKFPLVSKGIVRKNLWAAGDHYA